MICDSCYFNWKAVIYDVYTHRKEEMVGGCHLKETPVFNRKTWEYTCKYYTKKEEQNGKRNMEILYNN